MSKAFTLTTNGMSSVSDQTVTGMQKQMYTAHLVWDIGAGVPAGGANYIFQANGANGIFPTNSVITSVRLDCVTQVLGAAGSAITLELESAADIKVASPVSAAPFNGTLTLDAVAIKTTAPRSLVATVGGASPANDLTAGKIVALVDYFVTE